MTTFTSIQLIIAIIAMACIIGTLKNRGGAPDTQIAPALARVVMVVLFVVNALVFALRHVRWHA